MAAAWTYLSLLPGEASASTAELRDRVFRSYRAELASAQPPPFPFVAEDVQPAPQGAVSDPVQVRQLRVRCLAQPPPCAAADHLVRCACAACAAGCIPAPAQVAQLDEAAAALPLAREGCPAWASGWVLMQGCVGPSLAIPCTPCVAEVVQGAPLGVLPAYHKLWGCAEGMCCIRLRPCATTAWPLKDGIHLVLLGWGPILQHTLDCRS